MNERELLTNEQAWSDVYKGRSPLILDLRRSEDDTLALRLFAEDCFKIVVQTVRRYVPSCELLPEIQWAIDTAIRSAQGKATLEDCQKASRIAKAEQERALYNYLNAPDARRSQLERILTIAQFVDEIVNVKAAEAARDLCMELLSKPEYGIDYGYLLYRWNIRGKAVQPNDTP